MQSPIKPKEKAAIIYKYDLMIGLVEKVLIDNQYCRLSAYKTAPLFVF